MILAPLNSTLTAAVAAALTAVLSGITQAEAVGAQALSLSAQIATLTSQQITLTAADPNGALPGVVTQKTSLAMSLASVESQSAVALARTQLYHTCQAQTGLLTQLLTLAQAQAQGLLTSTFPANVPLLQNLASLNQLISGIENAFQGPVTGMQPDNLAVAVARATAIQSIFQAISNGTDLPTSGG